MLYTSINNLKIKNLKKLQQKKYRDIEDIFIVEGEHLVNEAFKSGYLIEVFVLENTSFKINVPINYACKSVLKFLSTLDNPSNVIGVCKKKHDKIIGDRIVVLDNIQDPGNLGTIIRSCVAFDIDTLILSSDCVDLYNSKTIRATQGLLFNLNIVICDALNKVKNLKENGYKIYGTKVNGGKELKTIEKFKKFVIIMGNEGIGIKNNLLNMCDEFIYIKMNENCESLNVGVATSIILYEMR